MTSTTMKESQRRAIWKTLRCLEAAEAINRLALNGHSIFYWEVRKWESMAHKLYREAGFDDISTFDLRAVCTQVCEDYEKGNLEVIPFE